MRRPAGWVVGGILIALAGLGLPAAGGGHSVAHWTRWHHLPGVVDVVGPRGDGRLVVAADGRLVFLDVAHGRTTPYAQGPGGYRTPRGPEPYIALALGAVTHGRCPFPSGALYALEPTGSVGIVRVGTDGTAAPFATVPGVKTLGGIAFDDVGRFGHRLLVTGTNTAGAVTVAAVDCHGQAQVVTDTAPRLEGGIVVAPATFGSFAGALIAPDERSGHILAIEPGGRSRLLVRSRLPAGPDTGVESAGVVPPGGGDAYVADRGTPGNPHPGTNSVLRLRWPVLAAAGVRGGDVLVVSEGGGGTVAVRCARRCTVWHVADGPRVSHVEGHVAFVPRR
jgi:hypothetical protein